MSRVRQAIIVVVVVFVAYAAATRPATTSAAAHAAVRGVGNGMAAIGRFLDDLVPHDATPPKR